MKFLFYLGHPAHYHNFKNVIKSLVQNHEVSLLVRPKEVLLDLIDIEDVEVIQLKEKTGRGFLSLIYDVLYRNLTLLKLSVFNKYDLLIGTDLSIAQIGRLLRLRSVVVNEDDAEAVPLFAKFAYPYAYKILAPKGCSTGNYEYKTIRYNGYHELAYLHPELFSAKVEVLESLGLKPKSYVIMRFSALNAHHDSGVKGIDDELALRIINHFGENYQVIISSERKLSADLEPYRMTFAPSKMHDVLAHAKLFIGDSQTMAAESMVLGTPSIRCNDFVGRLSYLEELETKYKLGIGLLPRDANRILEKIDEIFSNDNMSEEWQNRRSQMLENKINVAVYWAQLFTDLAKA